MHLQIVGYPPAGYPPVERVNQPSETTYPSPQTVYPPQHTTYLPPQTAYPPQQTAYPPPQAAYPAIEKAHPQPATAYSTPVYGVPGGQPPPPPQTVVIDQTPAESSGCCCCSCLAAWSASVYLYTFFSFLFKILHINEIFIFKKYKFLLKNNWDFIRFLLNYYFLLGTTFDSFISI